MTTGLELPAGEESLIIGKLLGVGLRQDVAVLQVSLVEVARALGRTLERYEDELLEKHLERRTLTVAMGWAMKAANALADAFPVKEGPK